jgi:hypothetical protein
MPGVRNQQLTFGELHHMLGKMALFGGICATIVQRNRERILTEEGQKGTRRSFGRRVESRLILVVCGIAVKEILRFVSN